MNIKELKRNCNIEYNIDNKTFKVGNLNDKQLEIAKSILYTRKTLSNEQKQQYDAIICITNYRASKSLEMLQNEVKISIDKRLIGKAFKTALHIEDWIEKSYKN